MINVLITGSNSGIGYATASFLASQGHYHVILACRTISKSKAALAQLQRDTGGNPQIPASVLELDVNDKASIQAAAKAVSAQFKQLDVLINNAGIYNPTKPLEIQLTQSFRTNVIGPALVTEIFTPLLTKSPNPYVIHVGSTLGSLAASKDPDRFDVNLRCIGYRTSKAALNMLAIENDKELRGLGIKVFAICPGLVESNLRGVDEMARTAGGIALKPETSAQFIADIIKGKRDQDVGKFLYEGGVRPW